MFVFLVISGAQLMFGTNGCSFCSLCLSCRSRCCCCCWCCGTNPARFHGLTSSLLYCCRWLLYWRSDLRCFRVPPETNSKAKIIRIQMKTKKDKNLGFLEDISRILPESSTELPDFGCWSAPGSDATSPVATDGESAWGWRFARLQSQHFGSHRAPSQQP